MPVRVASSGPRGRKTWEIRWKNGELYDYTDNAYAARKIAARARKEEREYYGGKGRQKNPGTKAERAVAAQKASAKRRVAVALANYLRQQNPGTALAGATVEKRKGGAVLITPIKVNNGFSHRKNGASHHLEGWAAIEFAERHGGTLKKYADSTERGLKRISIEKAKRVAREDPRLIYLDTKAK